MPNIKMNPPQVYMLSWYKTAAAPPALLTAFQSGREKCKGQYEHSHLYCQNCHTATTSYKKTSEIKFSFMIL